MRGCNIHGIVSRVCVLKGLHCTQPSLVVRGGCEYSNIQHYQDILKPTISTAAARVQPNLDQECKCDSTIYGVRDDKSPDYLQYKTAPFHRGQKSVTLLPITLLSPWTEGSPFPATNQIQLQFLLQIHTKTSKEVRQA